MATAAPIAADLLEARDQIQSGTDLDSTEWIGRGAGGYPGGMVNGRPHEGGKRSETYATINARGQAGGYPGGMVNDNPHGQERGETSGTDDSVRERDLEEVVNELDQRGINHIFGGTFSPWGHERSLEELIKELHQRELSEEQASASTMSERQAELADEPEGK